MGHLDCTYLEAIWCVLFPCNQHFDQTIKPNLVYSYPFLLHLVSIHLVVQSSLVELSYLSLTSEPGFAAWFFFWASEFPLYQSWQLRSLGANSVYHAWKVLLSCHKFLFKMDFQVSYSFPSDFHLSFHFYITIFDGIHITKIQKCQGEGRLTLNILIQFKLMSISWPALLDLLIHPGLKLVHWRHHQKCGLHSML